MIMNEIIEFESANWQKCIDILDNHWNKDYGSFKLKTKKGSQILELYTGGWSENEKIIIDIADTMFWFLWWQESKRGGYYKFIYKEVIKYE